MESNRRRAPLHQKAAWDSTTYFIPVATVLAGILGWLIVDKTDMMTDAIKDLSSATKDLRVAVEVIKTNRVADLHRIELLESIVLQLKDQIPRDG